MTPMGGFTSAMAHLEICGGWKDGPGRKKILLYGNRSRVHRLCNTERLLPSGSLSTRIEKKAGTCS
jgi:hypothetical protein